MQRLYQYVDLRGLGGIEMLFRAFTLRVQADGIEQGVVLKHGGIAPLMQSVVDAACDTPIMYKQPHGRRIPAWPTFLRSRALARALNGRPPGPLLVWSQLNSLGVSRAFHRSGSRVVHYEQGAAWLSSVSRPRARYLSDVDAVVCNSRAAQRVLELRWSCNAPMEVVPNPLRPDLSLNTPQSRQHPVGQRPVRIGMAGRLVPLKGMASGIAVLRELVDRSFDCELEIAGDGPLSKELQTWARKLGVESRVRFLGFVEDMGDFFDRIDLFLCPSVREPFGLVSIEAASRGCPVVATRVDGLPETLVEGKTGYSVPAMVDPNEYPVPHRGPLPEVVYDPDADALRPPRMMDPQRCADAIAAVLETPPRYEAMSTAAAEHAREAFAFERYYQQMMQVLRS